MGRGAGGVGARRKTIWTVATAVVVAAGVLTWQNAPGSSPQVHRPEALGPEVHPYPRPVWPPAVSDPKAVPPVTNLTTAAATAALESKGFEVTVDGVNDCGTEGRPTRTDPAAGELASEGHVTLLVTDLDAPSDDGGFASCAVSPSPADWRLFDFAMDQGDAPRFARRVTAYVDERPPTVLTGAHAADRDAWAERSALGLLGRFGGLSSGPEDAGGWWGAPHLSTYSATPAPRQCGIDHPRALIGRRARVMTLTRRGPDPCAFTVAVYRRHGRIDALVVRRPPNARTEQLASVPYLLGLDPEAATDAAAGQGLTVATLDLPTCEPVAEVRAQRPAPGTLVSKRAPVTVTIETEAADRPCDRLVPAATALAEYAAGGDSPRFAAEVDLLIGRKRVATLSAEQAADPREWELCVGHRDCPQSALVALAGSDQVDYRFSEAYVPDSPQCPYELQTLGHRPPTLPKSQAIILAPPPRDDCAGYYQVEVWVTARGAIRGVNVMR